MSSPTMIHEPMAQEREQQRVAALKSYHILDTLPEKEFDSLVELAAYICQTPISLLSLIDEKRQWCKAKVGVDIEESDRDTSFCQYTLLSADLYEVPDTVKDPLFADNPFVTGPAQARFYAGIPLINAAGYALGTLCVMDTKPRTLTEAQKNALSIVCNQIITCLELHKQKRDKVLEDKASDCLLQAINYASIQFFTVASYKKAIELAMPSVGEAADVNHIHIYKNVALKENTAEFIYQYQWSVAEPIICPDRADQKKVLYMDATIERWGSLLKAGKVIQGLVQDLPVTDKAMLELQGVKSVLVMPILIGHQLWGFIRFDECKRDRIWTPTEERFLVNLANTLGGAIARSQAEEEVLNTNKYLDNIINAIPAPIFIKDKHHRFILVNDACCELNGLSRENMLGKTDYDFFPEELAKGFWETEELAFRLGKTSVSEETVLRATNITTTVITQKAVFKNESGAHYLVGCNMDITDRKQTETGLAKEQFWVQSFMDHTPESIYFKDLESRFMRASQAMIAFLGAKDISELIGKTDFDFFLPEHAKQAYDTEQEIIKTGIPSLNFEEKETWPNGKITWACTTKMPLYDEEGKIIGTFGISRDITASKEAEIALTNSKNYLNHIFDTVPIPIFVKDNEHRFIFLNQAWSQFTGANKDEFIGKSDKDICSKEEARLFWERDAAVFKTGQGSIHEEIITCKNASPRTIMTNKTRFRDQYGKDFLVGTMIDISEIKTFETKLIHYQNYLNTIINTVADPIFVKDIKHRLILVNDSFCHFTGLSRENILNKTDYDLYSKEEADSFCKYDQIVFQSEQTHVNEETQNDPKGIPRTVITKKTFFMNELNESFLVGSMTDITERKKAEVALIAKEKYFRSLIQYSTDIISVLEADGKARYQSPSFYQALGLSESDTIGRLIFDFIHPEDVPHVLDVFSQLLQQPGVPLIVEYRFCKANGDWGVLESVATNWLDDEAVVGIVVNSRDVTERKKVEAEILDKSQVLHGIISNMPVAIFKTDSQGIFTQTLGTVVERMGMTEAKLIGTNLLQVCPQSAEDIKKGFAEGFATFVATTFANGKEWFLDTCVFEDKANAGGLIGFALDISGNKISERKLQEYAIDLEKINKELDQFAYIVSHDLKAPLRAIANLSQWIEEDLGGNLSEDVKGNLELLRSRVSRMQALISGILDYSKVNRTKITFEEVNVDALLKDIINILGLPCTHPITVQTVLPCIITNGIRLEQVFSNLISNAVKYHDKPSGNIRISYLDTPEFHQFSIADDGPGIALEYHDKIFVIFQTLQARDKVESTGVGLAIVKKIIEDQGGKIWIESEPGQGSTFIFTLPKQIKNSINISDHD
ncbi:MAG: PAS domain S-box protein [Bacteroidota bacterium]